MKSMTLGRVTDVQKNPNFFRINSPSRIKTSLELIVIITLWFCISV